MKITKADWEDHMQRQRYYKKQINIRLVLLAIFLGFLFIAWIGTL